MVSSSSRTSVAWKPSPSQFQRVQEILILKHANATYTSYFSLQDSHFNLTNGAPRAPGPKILLTIWHDHRDASVRLDPIPPWRAGPGDLDEGISRHKMSGSTHHNLSCVHLPWYNPVCDEPINCCRSIVLSWWNFQPL